MFSCQDGFAAKNATNKKIAAAVDMFVTIPT